MKAFIILTALVVAATAQYRDQDYPPIPYSFNYLAEGEDGGSSSHQEQGDGSGRVQGSYTVNDLEGHTRVVDYVADENGFRANIRTNEPGTANQNPADVVIESTAAAGGGAPAVTRTSQPVLTSGVATAGSRGRGAGLRYVLVPVNDPRAAGYY